MTDDIIPHYRSPAWGGAGLIIVETTCVDAPRGKTSAFQLAPSDDRYIPGLTSEESQQVARLAAHVGEASFECLPRMG